MARRDLLPSVSNGLITTIKDQVKPGLGSLKLTQKDKKTFARIFFKDGLIYGLEVSNYKPNIVTRIITNEFISDANRTQVLNKFEKTLNDFNVVKFVIDYQLFPERPLATYIKDYFFDAFDTVYHWQDLTVEWKSNDRISTGLMVSPTDPAEILKRLAERENILVNRLANEWAVHPREFKTLKFVKNFAYGDPDYTKQLLMSLPESADLTIGEMAEYFGLPYFNTEVDLFDIYQSGAIDIIHPKGVQFSNRSEQQIRESRDKNLTSPVTTQPSAPAVTLVEDIEETEFPPILEEHLEENHTDEQAYVESDEHEELVFITEEHSAEEEPKTQEEENHNYDYPSSFDLDDEDYVYETEETTDFYNEPTQSEATLEEEPEMSETGLGLSAMAQQMKALISEIKTKMNDAKAKIVTHDRIIQEKTNQKKALIAKLRALDVEINAAKEEKEEAVSVLHNLETEFNEFTQLLK